MRRNACRARSASLRIWTLLFIASPLVAAGCGSASDTERPAAAVSEAAQSGPAATAATASQAPFAPVDACALLTRSDVESLAGKKVLDGRKEEVAELVTCSFGDPEAPQIAGRALSQVLTLSVMTGRDGSYYAGAVAQAKDSFQMARKNAANAQPVSGLGDDAYWDSVLRKLSVLKGKHLVDVDVESGSEALKLATAAATKALERLPQ